MELQVGDTVNYSDIIGQPPISFDHEIIAIEKMPNNFGADVAWIKGKRGCVSMDALTLSGDGGSEG